MLLIHPLSAPPSLSPHDESTIAVIQQASPCLSNLVYYDPTKKQESVDTIIPELAERWSWQDNFRNLVFLLRKNHTVVFRLKQPAAALLRPAAHALRGRDLVAAMTGRVYFSSVARVRATAGGSATGTKYLAGNK